VLDVSCGTGPTCIYAALKGARRVVGVDILPGALDYARSKLHREYPELATLIEFRCTNEDLEEIGSEKFDLIISQISFENYSGPENIVAKFTEFVSEDGILAIAFAPSVSRRYHHSRTETTYSKRTRAKI
jgi:2-polyprenyl-3-methyl-5-hydroxy-6-metoxy-1,4-benzoquinol methylase